ncbi:hypothetical protein [Rhizosaccharibacter radicis]|uniref:Uncharacterized protein n=1 Tax=Rhizosaccharibacter radicis TaxID=2782605 RepID=A0ABT1VWJ3_9PROT|nr:hypothetical protein [Acetobacteraceae bacterium KSS12]
MKRHALYHCGLDRHGHRHWRFKTVAAMCRERERSRLVPRLVVAAGVTSVREGWRNGWQRRRWVVLVEGCRADRRSFLTTLRHPPLISPIRPRF